MVLFIQDTWQMAKQDRDGGIYITPERKLYLSCNNNNGNRVAK